MPLSINGPVGLRNQITQVANKIADQKTVLTLLAEITAADGGLAGRPGPLPKVMADGRCSAELAKAIWDFQSTRRDKFREPLSLDGVVSPKGKTLERLNALAPIASGKVILESHQITPFVQQWNPSKLADDHAGRYQVTSPVSSGGKYYDLTIEPSYRNLLFRVEHAGRVFWVGAGVPTGTTDFNKVQVFFHPTVVNSGVLIARDSDYPTFGGNWSAHMTHYTGRCGMQIAAARKVVALVPYNTMEALQGGAANMLSNDGIGLINKVMTAIQSLCNPYDPNEPDVTEIGLNSFSNGIQFLKLAAKFLGGSGRVREITDMDSPFIIGFHRGLTRLGGASSRCFSQTAPVRAEPGYVHMPADRFLSKDPVHGQIGWKVWWYAMLTSVIV